MPAPKTHLELYRRHRAGCIVETLKLTKQQIKDYPDCECVWWISGQAPDGSILPRASTKKTDKAEAERVRDRIIRDHTPGPAENSGDLSIQQAVERYLLSRRDELGLRTMQMYEFVLGKFVAFAHSSRAIMMRDITVDLSETFLHSGLNGIDATTRVTYSHRLRAFLKAAHRREWIAKPIVERMVAVRAETESKSPYTEEEVTKLLAGCHKMRGTIGYASQPATFRLLLELQLETGMRVGDAILFDPKICVQTDEVGLHSYTFTMQKKRRTQRAKPHTVYLTTKLKEAIDGCPWLSKSLPFHYGKTAHNRHLVQGVYLRMQAIGRRVEVKDCRPHRLRDTFAVRLLTIGTNLDDVSRLLGHRSVVVTERYYAKWIPARAKRLAGVAAQALVHPGSNGGGDAQTSISPLPTSGASQTQNTRLVGK
jgi:integrase